MVCLWDAKQDCIDQSYLRLYIYLAIIHIANIYHSHQDFSAKNMYTLYIVTKNVIAWQ